MSLAMSTEPLILRDHHYTVFEFDELPHGDGNRYEIIDGALVVTGSPAMRHQRAVGRIYKVLDATCPPEYEVFVAPFAVVLGDDTVMQPDVLVARVSDLIETELPAPPVLAVEVLSLSTKAIDLGLKPGRLARAGTPSYWTFNPHKDPEKAKLTVWELVDGGYRRVAEVVGDEAFTATVPYPVTVVPAALVR